MNGLIFPNMNETIVAHIIRDVSLIQAFSYRRYSFQMKALIIEIVNMALVKIS